MGNERHTWRLGALFAVAVAGALAGAGHAGELVLQAQVHWQPARAEFGGLSGIEVSADGARVLVVSDTGTVFAAAALRTDGVLAGLRIDVRAPLLTTRNEVPAPFLENAEALAVGADEDAGFYVAYEAWARVWHYAAPGAVPTWTHAWDRFWDMLGNEGFEALAIDASGALFVISEMAGGVDGAFPVHRYDGTAWAPAFAIPARDGFLPSGADFGPDGALYLLERRYRWHEGFSSRIRRLELDATGIAAETLLLDSPPGLLDNSEGISVWTGPEGRLRVTLVSDDNFNPLQRTLISEFVLVD